MKAIVNKEVAERQLADEELQASVNMQLRRIKADVMNGEELGAIKEKYGALDTKIDKVYDSLLMKYKNGNVESEAMLEEFQQLLNSNSEQINQITQ